MTHFDLALGAFADIRGGCPANHCQARDPHTLDLGLEFPGGWSSARRLVEGLYGGKAVVNLSQQRMGAEQAPTVEVLCDDPVLAAESFTPRDGLLGLRTAEGPWALAYREGRGTAEGNLVLAGPASLCAGVVDAGALPGRAAAYLLSQGMGEEELLWAWSCCPVVLPSWEAGAVQAARQAAAAEYGVCSIWVRQARPGLGDLARGWTSFRLRLHCMEDGRTYGA